VLPKWAIKPLFDCPPCMASVHGTWIHFILGGTLFWWPFFVLALCGAMVIITVEFLNRA
jgi:hypothetical protein